MIHFLLLHHEDAHRPTLCTHCRTTGVMNAPSVAPEQAHELEATHRAPLRNASFAAPRANSANAAGIVCTVGVNTMPNATHRAAGSGGPVRGALTPSRPM
ncbi:unnamed protein product, partial [Iphiclides podalirius]